MKHIDQRSAVPGVLASCLVAALMAGCGGGSAPEAVSGTDASPVQSAVTGPGESVRSATGPGVAGGGPAAAERAGTPAHVGPNTSVFVAGVRRGEGPDMAAARRAKAGGSDTPLRWLDIEPPRGTADAPVIVVMPGALPSDVSSMALRRADAQRAAK